MEPRGNSSAFEKSSQFLITLLVFKMTQKLNLSYLAGLLVCQITYVYGLSLGNRASPSMSLQSRGQIHDTCRSLQDAMPQLVYFPNSTQYTEESTAVWSETCLLHPGCVFEPSTAPELSNGLKIIKKTQSKFAVRSGGHMPVPGAQSVNDGVMISMSKFNSKTLNRQHSIASIGPGQTWLEVYKYLYQYRVAVNGGRYPSVGVGGVLMGGGMGYWSGSQGWGCDNVVGYQAVLSDGRVVEVTEHNQYADLFWALKGGHNNFAIVTRYDVRTFPVNSVYGGSMSWNSGVSIPFFGALESYMASGGGVDDPNSHVIAYAGVEPAAGPSSLSFSNTFFYNGAQSSPGAFENFTAINAIGVTSSTLGLYQNWTEISAQQAGFAVRTKRELFTAVSFKGDPRAIRLLNNTVVGGALRNLTHIQGLTAFAAYQPVSKDYLKASKRNNPGGNVLGLDPEVDGTFIGKARVYWQMSSMNRARRCSDCFIEFQANRYVSAGQIAMIWENAEDDVAVTEFADECARIIENTLRPLGLWNDFIYLNDAHQGQKPFESYAHGKNIPKLKKIQAKYDADNFIRDRLQHGFALK